VEHRLAKDLANAGITVILDQWESARIGASVHRFVERIASADRVIVVGTPRYRTKYDNDQPMGAFVLAAEGDLIGNRMIGSEAAKESVLPVLLEGTPEESLPPLLHGRVYADFRLAQRYLPTVFHLILSLYQISAHEPVRELRRQLEAGH
jgi:TIR domain